MPDKMQIFNDWGCHTPYTPIFTPLSTRFHRTYTVDPRVSPLELAYFFDLCIEAYSKGGLLEGGLKIFLVVGHIPVEIFLLINYFFDATHTIEAAKRRQKESTYLYIDINDRSRRTTIPLQDHYKTIPLQDYSIMTNDLNGVT